MTSLPETKKEIKNVSSFFGQKNIYFRDNATELNFRKSIQKNHNIIHLATHGLITGEFDGNLEEPALILSPVNDFYYNDGILKASEISQMNFNSDIVILSACNTAIENDLKCNKD